MRFKDPLLIGGRDQIVDLADLSKQIEALFRQANWFPNRAAVAEVHRLGKGQRPHHAARGTREDTRSTDRAQLPSRQSIRLPTARNDRIREPNGHIDGNGRGLGTMGHRLRKVRQNQGRKIPFPAVTLHDNPTALASVHAGKDKAACPIHAKRSLMSITLNPGNPTMRRPAFVFSPKYEMDIGRHVFPTSKFRLLKEQLVHEGVVNPDEIEEAHAPTDDELLTVLTPEYLNDLRSYRHTDRTSRSELPITREIVEGCITCAGGTIRCVERAMEVGGACHLGGGFHHGFAGHAEGFCYVNDVAIAAAVMLARGRCERIAIIDTDVHQGNGTARIFRDEPRVFTFSIHQERLYPAKEISDLDIGLENNIGDRGYLEALEEGIKTLFARFSPDLVINVAGADPYEDDVLGSLGLSMSGMMTRDRMVVGACVERSIPFVTVTGGGYARQLVDTVTLHANTVRACIDLLAIPPAECEVNLR